MSATVRVEGLREMENALAELAKHTTRRAVGRKALRAAGDPILAAMQANAPDDPKSSAPRDLRSSLAISGRQKSSRGGTFRPEAPSEVVIHIGPTKDGYPQAVMQEFGTSRHPPHAYMRPAWDAEGGEPAVNRIGESLGEEITKAAQRQARRAARLAR